MKHIIWIAINVLFLLVSTIYIWVFQKPDTLFIGAGALLGQVAVVLFLINVNMYFIFLVIRKSTKRNVRVTLAKIARRMMKRHITIAVLATTIILIHAFIMLTQLGPLIGFFGPKMISGYVGLVVLTLTLIGGYRRHRKATGFRRRFHLTMAMIFTAVFVIHLFMPF
ncbi:hypothetical protein BEP19_13830 [Ammoniphilus oxalaticus]|uniref:Ferric oxidoreductase domain-containing protein n=1 Tax=Ammoniphilus oxalaticus TaxID=66863 RepID=A0A419SEM1_9BACL|nr:hypothetical protein [Ammoniphilus oxalaticus]RKD21707.1 hypothetical protein BEP19_13830 [Ammoniphilus oxalaticus]